MAGPPLGGQRHSINHCHHEGCGVGCQQEGSYDLREASQRASGVDMSTKMPPKGNHWCTVAASCSGKKKVRVFPLFGRVRVLGFIRCVRFIAHNLLGFECRALLSFKGTS